MRIRVTGIDKTIAHIDRVENDLDNKMRQLSERLGILGIDTAIRFFDAAEYRGNKDVVVDSTPQWIDDHTLAISATGESVTFIEFGAGVYQPEYPDQELINEYGFLRGEYGQGKGKRRTWSFYLNGELVVTHGNPPARAMFEASQEMRKNIIKIAKEVFGND